MPCKCWWLLVAVLCLSHQTAAPCRHVCMPMSRALLLVPQNRVPFIALHLTVSAAMKMLWASELITGRVLITILAIHSVKQYLHCRSTLPCCTPS